MSLLCDPSDPRFVRLTGLFYLGIAVTGAFSIAYVPANLSVAGDGLATLDALITHRHLMHLGAGADALLMIFELFTLSLLYVLFKPVSPALSMAAAMARLSMVAVMSAMLFFYAGADHLAQGAGAETIPLETRAVLADLLMQMHRAGVWIWQVFFALHLTLLGILILASGWVPRVLGYGLMIGAWGYALDSVYAFALPELEPLRLFRIGLLAVVTVSELSFALWLTFRRSRPQAALA